MNPATGKKTSDVTTAKTMRNQFFPQANRRSWKGKTRWKARLVWQQLGLQWKRHLERERKRTSNYSTKSLSLDFLLWNLQCHVQGFPTITFGYLYHKCFHSLCPSICLQTAPTHHSGAVAAQQNQSLQHTNSLLSGLLLRFKLAGSKELGNFYLPLLPPT